MPYVAGSKVRNACSRDLTKRLKKRLLSHVKKASKK